MKKYLILFISIFGLSQAQEITNWQNYSNMQMVNDFITHDGISWAATEGGVFGYLEADSSYLTLTKSEGLSSHTITSIANDISGNIWLGTSDGFINVYTPSTSEMKIIYDISKTNESNKYINEIEISNDTAFVSTEFGLILFKTTDLSVLDGILKFGNFNSRTPVKNIFHAKLIYVVTEAGIAKSIEGFDNLQAPEAWENLVVPGVSAHYDLVIFNGVLYAATDRGVYRYNGTKWEAIYLTQERVRTLAVHSNELFCITGILNDGIWGNGKLYKLSPSEELLYSSSANLTKIGFLNNNRLIISTSSGIKILEGSKIIHLNPNTPATNNIISLAVDDNGMLWSATGKDGKGIGILKYDGQIWEKIDVSNNSQFKSNDFHVVTSSKNAVYLSTWGRGFVRFADDTYKYFNTDNTSMIGIPNANNFLVVNEIREDSKGNAWITNYWSADRKPISVLTKEGNVFNYQLSTPLSAQIINVKNLVVDQFDTKWFSGDLSGDVPTDGLYYFNENGTFENTSDDSWGKITVSNGLRNRDVKALAVDNFGELIVGTSIGVDVISDPSNPNSLRGDQYFAIRQQTINSIAVDPINQKWVGTEKGIFLLNSDGSVLLENFTKSNSPLPSDVINTIAIDGKNGIVYAGTDYGVTAIKTLYIKPNSKLNDLFIYPNPLVLNSNINNSIVIDGLIENSNIKILDISGNLVSEFRSIGGKTTTWNCKNDDGKFVSSGIYIVVAFDEEANEVGHAKFAILRK